MTKEPSDFWWYVLFILLGLAIGVTLVEMSRNLFTHA